jgi:isoleucyl-tRNA synthetase
LNVKHVRALAGTGEAVAYQLNPLPKQLGQKYKNLYPRIREAMLECDVEEVSHKLLDGQSFSVEVDGETYDIQPDEVEVRMDAREGFAVASEGAYMAALVTDLTPELVQEGLAREFVRRVQDLRKQADLDIADRIELYYSVSPGLAEAIQSFKDYIMGETLALELKSGPVPKDAPQSKDEFDGETMQVGLIKAG